MPLLARQSRHGVKRIEVLVDVDFDLLVIAFVYSLFFVVDAVQSSHLAMILDGVVVAFSLEAAREAGYYGH